MNETVLTITEAKDFLKKLEINVKPPELLEEETALGLKLKKDKVSEQEVGWQLFYFWMVQNCMSLY